MVGIGDLYGDFKTLCKQWFYEKSEVDTALNSKQNSLVSGTNIKTINHTSLLGSGNIDIQGGGSGGSCVTDFYIDSNTDEWVITTSACSQGEVVTQWEQNLSDEKVPSEKLVKNTIDGFVQYELSSSDYNPNVGSTITITCTCKDILGNPIPNKELELMLNGGSAGTSTTNENGIATWSNTFGSEGVKDHYIGNSHCIIVVNGYHKIYESGGLMWHVNRLTGISSVSLNRSGVSISANSSTVLKSAYSSTDSKVDYCPYTTHITPTHQPNVFLVVNYLGEIRLYNYRSTSFNASVQANTTFLGKSYRVG